MELGRPRVANRYAATVTPRLDIVEELGLALDALRRDSVPHALCGGFAVAVHGVPRATKDIDFLVPEHDVAQAEKTLKSIGFTLSAGPIPFGTGTPKERRIHRVTKVERGEHLTIDLLAVTDVFTDVWRSRLEVAWEGRVLFVVSREGLIAMKRLAGRPQDIADIAALGGPRAD
jgi:hypothetical protein